MQSELLGLWLALLLSRGPLIPNPPPPGTYQTEPESRRTLEMARELISDHEGLKLKMYKDSVGKTTIGYGRNLQDNGITRLEAEMLREADLISAYEIARRLTPGFQHLSAPRQAVVVDMAFNLGEPRLRQFVRFFAALGRQDFKTAAAEMVDSRWYTQVGRRGKRLARIMETDTLKD
jgi:lysozyme